MVVTCYNNGTKMDCFKATLHLDSRAYEKTQEMGMNNFSYEGSAREFCVHSGCSMLGLLISTGMPPFLDDLEEAIKEAKREMAGSNIGGK